MNCAVISFQSQRNKDKLYSTYLHDLVVHGPPQYQLICLSSANAESTERLFSQVKHISMRATNRKADVLTTVLLSMQTKENLKTGPNETQQCRVKSFKTSATLQRNNYLKIFSRQPFTKLASSFGENQSLFRTWRRGMVAGGRRWVQIL